jgi:hypothetical protein
MTSTTSDTLDLHAPSTSEKGQQQQLEATELLLLFLATAVRGSL